MRQLNTRSQCKPLKLIPTKQGKLPLNHPALKREYEWYLKRYKQVICERNKRIKEKNINP